MKYIVFGLGNIGTQYELTRHNIGFLAVDYIADKHEATFKTDRLGDVAHFSHKGRQIYLVKPSTYMNLSGKAVNYWTQQLKVPVENILVITDEVALPFGKIRMRPKGSNGGHNGLGNIEATLQTRQYPRLRFGIGNDYPKGGQVNYVLSRFTEAEFEALPDYLQKTYEATTAFCTIGIDRAMNSYNK
ncbi:MAG: aminoacyl-tRNA hydrolase [Thermonemataceae bacterium]